MPKQIFEQEEIEVDVPEQEGKKPKIVKLDLGKIEDYPSKKDGFKPKRLLLNFGVVEEDSPDVFLEEFNPPIKVQVKFKKKDKDDAESESGKALKLAYWNGEEWVIFTTEKHHLQFIEDGKGGGTATLEIRSWGDPPLAWGN